MRFFIITFGIGALLLNGLMFYGVAYYLPEVKIGIGGALIATDNKMTVSCRFQT